MLLWTVQQMLYRIKQYCMFVVEWVLCMIVHHAVLPPHGYCMAGCITWQVFCTA